MALLSEAQRKEALRRWVRANRTSCGGGTKQDAQSSLDDIDQWLHDNRAAINTAIGAAYRNRFSAEQKLQALRYIMEVRDENGVH